MNWLAIIVATAVNIALGALWFSPTLFQKPWIIGLAGASTLVGGALIGVYAGLGFVRR
jgi:hypothetical protein